MRQRQDLREPLDRAWHPGEREHEPREQDRRQEHEERHLHRLELRLRAGRDQQAEGEVGDDQQHRGEIDIEHAAAHRHLEQPQPEQQHQGGLHQPDRHVGQYLADHQFGAGHRRRDQQFHVAALAFAHDRNACEQHHGHGQDHPDQAWHDVHRRASLRVVETDHADLLRRGLARAGRVRQRAAVVQRHLRQLHRRALHDGVAAVDQHLHRLAAVDASAFEIRRHHHADADLAAAQGIHQLLWRVRRERRLDHAGRDHVHHQRTRSGRVRHVRDARRQPAQVEVDRVTEQHQLHHRDADDHRQRDPVAAQLPQFLQHHR